METLTHCTKADIIVRPDHYYKMDQDGEPTGKMVNSGGEHLYYCTKCSDVSYSLDETEEHIKRSDGYIPPVEFAYACEKCGSKTVCEHRKDTEA